MYLSIGRFVDEAPYASDYTFMNIYYRSIREREQDHLKTLDYIWRWDTDWFWCSRAASAISTASACSGSRGLHQNGTGDVRPSTSSG